jgi:hypothetical protein
MSALLKNIREAPGYSVGLALSAVDLGQVKGLISEHLAIQIDEIDVDMGSLFRRTPLEEYHTISAQMPHDKLLTRKARILSQDAVDVIRKTSLFTQIEAELGPVEISDEEQIGRESISIRLVRPGMHADVGSLHTDHWFWDLYNFSAPVDKSRIKIWIGVCCETGKSGLLLVPDSHQRDWNYSVIERAGMLKPLFDEGQNPNTILFQSNPGDAVAFNYKLLHGGALTQGTQTRVSIEFTLLVPNRVFNETIHFNN